MAHKGRATKQKERPNQDEILNFKSGLFPDGILDENWDDCSPLDNSMKSRARGLEVGTIIMWALEPHYFCLGTLEPCFARPGVLEHWTCPFGPRFLSSYFQWAQNTSNRRNIYHTTPYKLCRVFVVISTYCQAKELEPGEAEGTGTWLQTDWLLLWSIPRLRGNRF